MDKKGKENRTQPNPALLGGIVASNVRGYCFLASDCLKFSVQNGLLGRQISLLMTVLGKVTAIWLVDKNFARQNRKPLQPFRFQVCVSSLIFFSPFGILRVGESETSDENQI